jgi:hypothetical protein
MMLDSEAYLEPGFDPNTLKVAELRGILLKHDVEYPSSAKKAVLVDLFNQHVAPQAKTLRNANTRIKPSAKGMINAGHTPERYDFDKIGTTPRRSSRPRGTVEDTTEDDEEVPTKKCKEIETICGRCGAA